MGAVALGPFGYAPFPIPAHRTGRAQLRHPALRLDLSRDTQKGTLAASVVCAARVFLLRPSIKLSLRGPDQLVFAGSAPITFTSPPSKAHQKSGPFAPPALPSFNAPTTLSDSHHGRRLWDVEAAVRVTSV